MRVGAPTLNLKEPLSLDTKPGAYSVFLSAYAMNVGLYQLNIDKVHSDYGSIPMALRPGSRVENGATPVVDSTNLNRFLALVSAFLYAPDALPSLVRAKPQIFSFGIRHSLPVFERSVQLWWPKPETSPYMHASSIALFEDMYCTYKEFMILMKSLRDGKG